jgi:hypothetical protein
MKNEFIPYEQALALKELGFDEPCFGKYLSSLQSDWKVYELILEMGMNEEFEDNRNTYLLEKVCSSPTYSQTFRWFRENYNTQQYVIRDMFFDNVFTYKIEYIKDNDIVVFCNNDTFSSYEEAELACLKKLIEIVKEK